MSGCDTCGDSTHLCEIVPKMAGIFKALGDLTRLKLMYLLTTDRTGTLGVSELATRLGISQPAVSQHLKVLKSEGIVDARRNGSYIYYFINRDRMIEFHDNFELMYSCVMDRCNRELILESTPEENCSNGSLRQNRSEIRKKHIIQRENEHEREKTRPCPYGQSTYS